MDLTTLHRRTVENWQRLLGNVDDDQWNHPTPCTEWDVRALVNHVVGEELWTRPLLEGSTIAEVGDRFDGDVLGDEPIARGQEASHDAAGAADKHLPDDGIVHVSFGDIPATEYVRQLSADHLIHAWDLAAATGQPRDMDPELVAEVAAWFETQEAAYRSSGAVGPRPDSDGDPAAELLAGFGRQAGWRPPSGSLATMAEQGTQGQPSEHPSEPPSEHEIDQVVVDYVQHTANRFGVQGLEDMIELAKEQLVAAQAALKELADLDG